jgi:hypothetical protein
MIQIKKLCGVLSDNGFSYIVFDCPAELKNISTALNEFNKYFNFENIFVSTLYEPAIEPILQEVQCGEFINSKNNLVINKIRPLETKYLGTIDDLETGNNERPESRYLESKEVFIEYLRGNRLNEKRMYTYAREYYRRSCNFNDLGFIPWNEFLETLFVNKRDPLDNDDYDMLIQIMGEVFKGFLLD